MKRKEPELLPGAELDKDCQPTVPVDTAVSPIPTPDHDDHEEDEHEHAVRWDALNEAEHGERGGIQSWQGIPSRWAVRLEKIALAVERPVNRLIGNPQLNPFYHTGTIAVFLTLVVGLTGFYIFLFFQYGFDASYESVARMDSQFIARVMRAVHRYASGALVVTTLLHAYRTLFMEQFRGQRWLAWVTGIVMTAVIWLAGVTGYWLVWDQRAQLITDSFVQFLDRYTPWATDFVLSLATAEQTGVSWPILLIILAVHVLLFLMVAGFFWLHIRRLSRAKWLPEMHLVLGLTAVLIIISALFPLRILPAASNVQLPDVTRLDPFFLFYLAAEDNLTAVLLWGGLGLITIVGLALPWITRNRVAAAPDETAEVAQPATLPRVNIIKDRCTGCTKCALDCPYGAIQMVERHDGKPHKFIAIEDPDLCVSCGICVGSCDGVAVTLGHTPPEFLADTVAMQIGLARARAPEGKLKLVFTCERHAAHGAQPFLTGQESETAVRHQALEIVTLPCVGTLPPDLLVQSLKSGADEIQVIGCPPYDCRNREGNLWTAERLLRQRVPRLKRDYANAPITAVWVPPDQFTEALQTPVPKIKADEEEEGKETGEPDYMAARRFFQRFTWRHLLVSFGLLALVMIAQIFIQDIVFRPAAAMETAVVRVLVPDVGKAYIQYGAATLEPGAFALQLMLNGDQLAAETYNTEALFAATGDDGVIPYFSQHDIEPGEYDMRLILTQNQTADDVILYENNVDLAPGDILRIHVQPRGDDLCIGAFCVEP